MTSLLGLPKETLVRILTYLRLQAGNAHAKKNGQKLKTLISASHTCRVLAHLSRTEIYRTIDANLIPFRALRLLIRTLSSNLQYCDLVEHIDLKAWDLSGYRALTTSEPLFPPGEAFLSVSERIREHLSHMYDEGIYLHAEIYIARLVYLCMRVRTLAFGPIWFETPCMISALFKTYFQPDNQTDHGQFPAFKRTLLSYRRLNQIEYITGAGWQKTGSQYLLSVPALDIFKSNGFFLEGTWNLSNRIQSNIRTFHLHDSWMDPTGLKTLFETCPLLTDLSIHGANIDSRQGGAGLCEHPGRVHWGRIGEVLRSHGARLRRLEIDLEYRKDPDRDLAGIMYPAYLRVGDLSSLTSLCHLALPYDAFRGVIPQGTGFRRTVSSKDQSRCTVSKYLLAQTLPKSLKSFSTWDEGIDYHGWCHELGGDQSFRDLTLLRYDHMNYERDVAQGQFAVRTGVPLQWHEVLDPLPRPVRRGPYRSRIEQNMDISWQQVVERSHERRDKISDLGPTVPASCKDSTTPGQCKSAKGFMCLACFESFSDQFGGTRFRNVQWSSSSPWRHDPDGC